MKGPKRPWIAAVMALALGGPGCFYLGWRRGATATLVWLPITSLLFFLQFGQDALAPESSGIYYLFLILLQAGLASTAYRSCRRTNAEAAKADRVRRMVGHNLQPKVEPDCSKKLKDIGVFVIVGSGFALLAGATSFNMPRMGELGNFAHAISPLVLCMGAWGLATAIGLFRAWRWARISMLVFSSLLSAVGILGLVAYLFMPNGDVSGLSLLLLKTFVFSQFLIPVVLGVWWLICFTKSDVKAHFRTSRKAPIAVS